MRFRASALDRPPTVIPLDKCPRNDYSSFMPKQPSTTNQASRRKPALEEEIFLELLRTAEAVMAPVAVLLRTEDLSPPQYNVLRILRGRWWGLSCSEIVDRMVTRDPDMTRLLDRLAKRDFITRSRSEEDRRVVLVRIAAQGEEVLRRLDEPILAHHRDTLGLVGKSKLRELSALLVLVQASLGGH